MTTTTTTADTTLRNDDPDYEGLPRRAAGPGFVQRSAGQKLFTVAAPDLYDASLDPAAGRGAMVPPLRRMPAIRRAGSAGSSPSTNRPHPQRRLSVADAPPIYAQAVAELIHHRARARHRRVL